MKIGILTYSRRHRKTYDTICLLKAKGIRDVTVYAVPYHNKKYFEPLWEHRPQLYMDIPHIDTLFSHMNYEYI